MIIVTVVVVVCVLVMLIKKMTATVMIGNKFTNRDGQSLSGVDIKW